MASNGSSDEGGSWLLAESRKRWREMLIEGTEDTALGTQANSATDVSSQSSLHCSDRPSFIARNNSALADLLFEMKRDLESWRRIHGDIVSSSPSSQCVAKILDDRLQSLAVCVERLEKVVRTPLPLVESAWPETDQVPSECSTSTAASSRDTGTLTFDLKAPPSDPDTKQVPANRATKSEQRESEGHETTIVEPETGRLSATKSSNNDESETGSEDALRAIQYRKRRRLTGSIPGAIEVYDVPCKIEASIDPDSCCANVEEIPHPRVIPAKISSKTALISGLKQSFRRFFGSVLSINTSDSSHRRNSRTERA